MSFERKKARTDGGTSERAMRDNTAGNAMAPSQEHFTRIHKEGQGRIEALLGRGQETALSQAELERITGLPRRTIRRMIEAERRDLIPILSDDCGYFLPKYIDEAAYFITSMRRRANEILNTAKCVEKAIEQAQFTDNLFDMEDMD